MKSRAPPKHWLPSTNVHTHVDTKIRSYSRRNIQVNRTNKKEEEEAEKETRTLFKTYDKQVSRGSARSIHQRKGQSMLFGWHVYVLK